MTLRIHPDARACRAVAVDVIPNLDEHHGVSTCQTGLSLLTPTSCRSYDHSVAVGVQMDFKGSTLDRYDEAMERLGLLPGGPSAKQQLFHWATKTDDGVRVVDVWESRQAFEDFLNAKILVVAQEVGVSEPPEIQFFEVHNYLAGGRWRG